MSNLDEVTQHSVYLPKKLHPATQKLLVEFSEALGEKLLASQLKYGHTDDWSNSEWMDVCRTQLKEHLEKGDPRDVAAYAAFLWYHGEPTVKVKEIYE